MRAFLLQATDCSSQVGRAAVPAKKGRRIAILGGNAVLGWIANREDAKG